MKKIFWVCILLTSALYSNAQVQKVKYEVTARNMALKAVNSYPQELITAEYSDSIYRVILTTFPAYDNVSRRKIVMADKYLKDHNYPDSVTIFLFPTALTDSKLPKIRMIADSLLTYKDSLSIEIIDRFLKYTSKRIVYDNDLAQKLDQGKCLTLDVKTILERGKGTCSEYANLFIALMRAANIPCRMAVGYIYMPENNFEGSHAWAECYIKGYGWLAVDPQNGFYWYPSCAIKLFHGRDFMDCNIKTLPDMYPVKVKKID